jgi:hypothetical protein
VSRPYDAVMSIRHLLPQPYSRRRDPTSWPCWAPCCLHQIPGWLNDRYRPAAVIKRNLYPEPPMRKLHFHPSSALSLFLFFQLALATQPLKHLSHLFHYSRARCSPCSSPMSRRSSE